MIPDHIMVTVSTVKGCSLTAFLEGCFGRLWEDVVFALHAIGDLQHLDILKTLFF